MQWHEWQRQSQGKGPTSESSRTASIGDVWPEVSAACWVSASTTALWRPHVLAAEGCSCRQGSATEGCRLLPTLLGPDRGCKGSRLRLPNKVGEWRPVWAMLSGSGAVIWCDKNKIAPPLTVSCYLHTPQPTVLMNIKRALHARRLPQDLPEGCQRLRCNWGPMRALLALVWLLAAEIIETLPSPRSRT